MAGTARNKLTDLQNGSDIRGIAIQTDQHTITLTDEAIEQIASGFTAWLQDVKKLSLKSALGIRVAIGHDSRLSANRIKNVLMETLVGAGIHVVDTELSTTPAMFMATQYKEYDCDASIMITASHLPFEYNGLKFFTKDGGAEKEDIAYILQNTPQLIEGGQYRESGTVSHKPLLKDYAEDLVNKIRLGIDDQENYEKPLTGHHILVDAGNGAGGFFASSVLAELGADITGSQFLKPDGHFPNHVPNPDNHEAMSSLQNAVLENKADMGIIFDTDVDRSALVDRHGAVLNRNNLIAVISAIVLQENPETTIVTNSTTSEHLKNFIEDLGGKQERYISGYRNVINRAVQLNKEGILTPLAIETSGHAALKENYFLDDGAYLAAKILIKDAKLQKEGKELYSLIQNLKQPIETDEVRFKILAADVQETGKKVMEKFKQFVEQPNSNLSVEPNNQEGVRVNTLGVYETGWLLLRMSLHEPLLVLNIESDQPGSIALLKKDLKPFFQQQTALDSSSL